MSVRLERVIVDLDDRFTAPASRIAASSTVMARRMDSADRSVKKFDRSNTDLARSIDYMAVRISTASHLATTFGTALVPLTTAAVPAVAGLVNQLGFAAIAGGTAIVAFQGVGDAVKAMGEYELDPTAKNLAKVEEALATMSESGREFARTLNDLRPEMRSLRTAAQDGLFPGLTDSLDILESRFPDVARILNTTGEALGDLSTRGAEAIAGPEWDRWFDMVATEARPALEDMGTALGNFTQGLAEMWMAFMPMSRGFGSGLAGMAQSFNSWAQGLSGSEGFQGFLDYVSRTAPEVLDTLGALAMMLVDVGTAFAPVGDVALDALRGLAEAISAIATSDIGPVLAAGIAAMKAYALTATLAARSSQAFATSQGRMAQGVERQRAAVTGLRADWAAYTAVQNSAQGRAQATAAQIYAQEAAQKRLGASLRETAVNAGRAAAPMAALGLAMTGVADDTGASNTAMLALMGTMAGPWGAAAGGAIGAFMDLRAAAQEYDAALAAISGSTQAGNFDQARQQIAALNAELREVGVIRSRLDLVAKNGTSKGGLIGGLLAGRAAQDATAELGRLEAANVRAERSAARIEGYQAQAAAITASREAARKGAEGFLELSGIIESSGTSLRSFINEYSQSVADMASASRNAAVAAARGLDEGFIQQLMEMGPKGATLLRQFADATDAQINRQNRAFQRGQAGMEGYARALEGSTITSMRDVKALAEQYNLLPRQIRTLIRQTGAEPTRERVEEVVFAAGRIPARVLTQVREQGATQARGTIVELTRQYNLTPRQVRTLIAESGGTPTRAMIQSIIREANRYDGMRPTATLSAVDRASEVVRRAQAAINSLTGRSVTVTTYYRGVQTGSHGTSMDRAHGGIDFYAVGGFHDPRDIANHHQPELAGPGMTRIWREPETKGEAYIPLADDYRRPRAQAIAAETVALLGGVAQFADGGRRGGSTPRQRINRQFDIGTLNVQGTQRELNQFERAIKRSGGRVGKNFDQLSKRIIASAREFTRLKAEVEATKEAQKSAADAARTAFNNDIFGGSARDLKLQLEADRNDSRASAAAIASIVSKGGGKLAGEMAGSGNLALAQEFAQMSRQEIASYEALYASRTAAQNSLARQATAAYERTIAQLTAQMNAQTRVLNQLEKAVERGARAGTKGQARAKTTKAKAKGKR